MDNQRTEKIGAFISERRKAAGLTQKELAQRLGVTDKAVSKWERGQSYPDISLIIPLSKLLGATANELLSGGTDNGKDIAASQSAEAIAAKRPDESNVSSERHSCTVSSKPDETVQASAENSGQRESITVPAKKGAAIAAYHSPCEKEKVKRANWDRIRGISLILLSGAVLTAIVVCMICDLAITDRLTWSPIVISSCIAGYLLALPLLKARRRVVMKTLIVLTLITIPYLWILSLIIGERLIFTMGSVIYLVSIAGLWLMYAAFALLKGKKLYAGGISFIIAIPMTVLINHIAENFVPASAGGAADDAVNAIFMLVLSAACFLAGYFLYHGKKRGDDK